MGSTRKSGLFNEASRAVAGFFFSENPQAKSRVFPLQIDACGLCGIIFASLKFEVKSIFKWDLPVTVVSKMAEGQKKAGKPAELT